MLTKLKEKYSSCDKCTACMNKNKLFGYGNPNADIMIVGEGPGGVEIESGIPFSGPAGQLLDKILASIDIKREDLYFTNTVLCRTNEKNRTPSWDEMQNCADRLDEEINIVKPNVILMVGSPSLKRFFGKDSKVTECHGRWFLDFRPPYARYFSIMHPSWILHASTPGEETAKKRTMWQDIKSFSEDLVVANFELRREECIEEETL